MWKRKIRDFKSFTRVRKQNDIFISRIRRMGKVIVSLRLSVHTEGGGCGGTDRGWEVPCVPPPDLAGGYLPWMGGRGTYLGVVQGRYLSPQPGQDRGKRGTQGRYPTPIQGRYPSPIQGRYPPPVQGRYPSPPGQVRWGVSQGRYPSPHPR